jgi:hypothetical protein
MSGLRQCSILHHEGASRPVGIRLLQAILDVGHFPPNTPPDE